MGRPTLFITTAYNNQPDDGYCYAGQISEELLGGKRLTSVYILDSITR
jgi:hypothetical protein